MIKVNGRAIFTEEQETYAARLSLDISPNSEYNKTKFQIETPLTQEQYTSIKKSIKAGNKLDINIEGILEAIASVDFEEKSKRT